MYSAGQIERGRYIINPFSAFDETILPSWEGTSYKSKEYVSRKTTGLKVQKMQNCQLFFRLQYFQGVLNSVQ